MRDGGTRRRKIGRGALAAATIVAGWLAMWGGRAYSADARITTPKGGLPDPFATPPSNAKVPEKGVATDPKRQADADRIFDYLMKEYGGFLTKTKDRLGRSLILVCMSRIPRADATAEILKVLKTDKDALVQMVAWQCLLARSSALSEAEYKQWFDATPALAARGAFRGDLRLSLAEFLATSTPDKRSRDMFALLFANTNSQELDDRKVMSMLGRTLGVWRDSATVEYLIGRMATLNDTVRAEDILRAAGVGEGVPHSTSRFELGSAEQWRLTAADFAAAWKKEKPATPVKVPTEAWKSLQAQYVPAVDFTSPVNPDEKTWYRDLELRSPALKTFGVGLMVDTTGSMENTILWLRHDVRRIMQAFGLVALEPQIAITFYRDFGDAFITKPIPLTGNVEPLVKELQAMTAKGGGDEPEAVREALKETLASSRWPGNANVPKALVLVTDAKPHSETQKECEKIVSDSAAKGFRTYVVKVHSGWEDDTGWNNLDALAKAGKGVALEVDFRTALFGGGMSMAPPAPPTADEIRARMKEANDAMRAANAARNAPPAPAAEPGVKPAAQRLGGPVNIKPASPWDDINRPPGERVVTHVIVDVVNPGYADRVQPVIATLWQMLAEHRPEQQYPHPPIPKVTFTPPPIITPPPPMRVPVLPPQPPPPPYDPQKQR